MYVDVGVRDWLSIRGDNRGRMQIRGNHAQEEVGSNTTDLDNIGILRRGHSHHAHLEDLRIKSMLSNINLNM